MTQTQWSQHVMDSRDIRTNGMVGQVHRSVPSVSQNICLFSSIQLTRTEDQSIDHLT